MIVYIYGGYRLRPPHVYWIRSDDDGLIIGDVDFGFEDSFG